MLCHLPCNSPNKKSILTLFPTLCDDINTIGLYYCLYANAIWKSKAIKGLILSKIKVKMREKILLCRSLINFPILRWKINCFLSLLPILFSIILDGHYASNIFFSFYCIFFQWFHWKPSSFFIFLENYSGSAKLDR